MSGAKRLISGERHQSQLEQVPVYHPEIMEDNYTLQQKIFESGIPDESDGFGVGLSDLYQNGIEVSGDAFKEDIAYRQTEEAAIEFRAGKVYDTMLNNMDQLQKQLVRIMASEGVPWHRVYQGVCDLCNDLYLSLTMDNANMHHDPSGSYNASSTLLQQILSYETTDPLGLLLQNNIQLQFEVLNIYNGTLKQEVGKLEMNLPGMFKHAVQSTAIGDNIQKYDQDNLIAGMFRYSDLNMAVGTPIKDIEGMSDRIRSSIIATYHNVDTNGFQGLGRDSVISSIYHRLVSEEGCRINEELSELTRNMNEVNDSNYNQMHGSLIRDKGIGRWSKVKQGIIKPSEYYSSEKNRAIDSLNHGEIYDDGGEMRVEATSFTINKDGFALRHTNTMRDKSGNITGDILNRRVGNGNAPSLGDHCGDNILLGNGQAQIASNSDASHAELSLAELDKVPKSKANTVVRSHDLTLGDIDTCKDDTIINERTISTYSKTSLGELSEKEISDIPDKDVGSHESIHIGESEICKVEDADFTVLE